MDTTGSLRFSFQTRMDIQSLYMRSSKAQQYYPLDFSKNATNHSTISIPDLEGDGLRDVGIMIIFHYEIQNLTSI